MRDPHRRRGTLRVFTGHTEEVRGVAFLDDDRLASCSGDGTLRLWNTQTAAQLDVTDTSPLYCLAPHPRGGPFAVGGSHGDQGIIYVVSPSFAVERVIVISIAPTEFAPLSESRTRVIGIVADRRDDANVGAIAWHPDGRHLVTGGWDYVVKMFDTTTGDQVRAWTGHSHWVTAAAVTSDGARIVSGGSDGFVRIWRADANICIHEVELPGSVADLELVGDTIYAASSDGNVYVLP